MQANKQAQVEEDSEFFHLLISWKEEHIYTMHNFYDNNFWEKAKDSTISN